MTSLLSLREPTCLSRRSPKGSRSTWHLGEPEAATAAGMEFHAIPDRRLRRPLRHGRPDADAPLPTNSVAAATSSSTVGEVIGRSSVLAASLLVLNRVCSTWSTSRPPVDARCRRPTNKRTWITGFPRFTETAAGPVRRERGPPCGLAGVLRLRQDHHAALRLLALGSLCTPPPRRPRRARPCARTGSSGPAGPARRSTAPARPCSDPRSRQFGPRPAR